MRSKPIDSFRGLAIAMVVACHYWSAASQFGEKGVDLFFVLSGFLIGGILLDNKGASGFFSVFYLRRAFRILPLYWLLLLVVPLDQPVWHFLFFGQTIQWMNDGAFPIGSPQSVTWSLALEEQFYLILPILVWALPTRTLVRVLWLMVIAAPVCRWAVSETSNPLAMWFFLPCRLDELMGGVLVACYQRGHCKSPRVWLWSAIALSALDIGACMVSASSGLPRPSMTWLAAVFSGIVLLSAHANVRWFTFLRPLSWLGIGTYSIYLVHLPILSLCGGNRVVALSLCVGAAWASWVCIERPLTQFARSRWGYGQRSVDGPMAHA